MWPSYGLCKFTSSILWNAFLYQVFIMLYTEDFSMRNYVGFLQIGSQFGWWSISTNTCSNDGTPTSSNTTNVSKNRQVVLLQTVHNRASATAGGTSVQYVYYLIIVASFHVTERLQRQLNFINPLELNCNQFQQIEIQQHGSVDNCKTALWLILD